MSDAWDATLQSLESAVHDFVRGDGTAYRSLWSRRDDVCLMGAYGGIITGWADVSQRIEWAADHFATWKGSFTCRDVLATVSGDLAVLVREETIINQDAPNEPQSQHRRLTLAFRQEHGQWRIFHQHSDPMTAHT
ncbi:YybH family protein [Streptomyces enissocaesilis]|uniref:SnoaL-like domain-containing protein n=1 Tax=Streptomyces enissocaesilis TaxID=332589 RepID=A0ABN3XQU2_9ACTN